MLPLFTPYDERGRRESTGFEENFFEALTGLPQLGVTPMSYTSLAMPSKHPRIAVTADPELGEALARVRAATGTREADATLLRRLAVEGAEAELKAGRNRRVAAEELFEAMGAERFDLDLDAVDRLNAPPAA